MWEKHQIKITHVVLDLNQCSIAIAIQLRRRLVASDIDSPGEYRVDRSLLLMAADWCSGDQRRRWSYDVKGGVHD